MRNEILGEFMGTLVLILLGDGVVAAVSLKRTKAEGAGWLVVTTAWAFAVLCGIFVSLLFGSPDAHLSPAFTLAFGIKNHEFRKLLPYALAQVAGAFCGAVLVWLFYFQHWKETPDAGTKLGVFCTSPAIRSPGWNLLSEVMATFVLVLVAGAISSNRVVAGWKYGVCDQSGAGFGAAVGACDFADCGEGWIGLGVCVGAGGRAYGWGGGGWVCFVVAGGIGDPVTRVLASRR